jgi:hypothetical protein
LAYTSEGKPKGRTQFLDLVPQIEAGVTEILSMDTKEEKAIAKGIQESWGAAGKVGLEAMRCQRARPRRLTNTPSRTFTHLWRRRLALSST